MALATTTTDVDGILPPEYGSLVERPLRADALAFNPAVATTVATSSTTFHVPVVTDDVAATWPGEGQQINVDDPGITELVVTPAKCAALTRVSNELANDSSPSAQEIVGRSIAASLTSEVDKAFFGDLAAPAAAGIGSLGFGDISYVNAATFANLDPFAEALAECEQQGGRVTAFVTDPATALDLATLKVATGSLAPLLGVDATNGTARQILGVPLFVSRHVEAGVCWALDASTVITVLREGVQLAISHDSRFDYDQVAIRGIVRVGFAFPAPRRIIRISDVMSA